MSSSYQCHTMSRASRGHPWGGSMSRRASVASCSRCARRTFTPDWLTSTVSPCRTRPPSSTVTGQLTLVRGRRLDSGLCSLARIVFSWPRYVASDVPPARRGSSGREFRHLGNATKFFRGEGWRPTSRVQPFLENGRRDRVRYRVDTGELAGLGDGGDAVGIVERREIAGIFSEVRGADHPAHDFRATGLGQLCREEDALGLEGLAHLTCHQIRDLRA